MKNIPNEQSSNRKQNIISSNRKKLNNALKNNDKLEIELDGRFRYTTSYFCCCTKLIDLYFSLTKKSLLFYRDKEKSKLFLEIDRNSVVAINKRQIDKNDVFKFSIYYQNPGDPEITEIKLKANNKSDTDRWISNLRRFIQPKRYNFIYDKSIEKDAEEVFPFKDTRKLYLTFCHLEYILLRGRMSQFFVYIRKLQNEKWNKNNNSYIFDKKDENEKFISNKNIELNDIDVEI